jgi:hypothetical protein
MSTILNQDLDIFVICKADKKTMIEIGLTQYAERENQSHFFEHFFHLFTP